MLRFYFKRVVTAILIFSFILASLWIYTQNIGTILIIKHLHSVFVPETQFVIKSPNCKIIDLKAFDESILKYVEKIEPDYCGPHPPLTTVTYDPATNVHVLRVNTSAIAYYTNSSIIRCCLKRFLKFNISVMVFTRCEVFHNSFVMDKTSEFVFVFCLDKEQYIFYRNMHAAVIKENKFKKRYKRSKERLNVLLIGIDSMSRLNLYRTMPKTAAFLHSHGWVEMKGYNKIADNTLPNMMAFLTGLPPKEFQSPHTLDLDEISFIWKEFSAEGYVTAYAEDTPLVSTFHCHMKGFTEFPTDYYFRDYIYAGELLMMNEGRPPGCIAYKLSSQHVFDFMLDFVTVFKKDSIFGLFWLNQISHNDLNRASREDEHVLAMLEGLVESGVMETTMVVLLSDHGLRVGDFRRTLHGWYEDRLPMLFISLPNWYKNKNSLQFKNLLSNTHRLTSPYDLYLTMKHLLHRERFSAAGCESCHSLLEAVNPDRSCSEAGISPHWCTCHSVLDVPTGSYASVLADVVVDAVNDRLSNDPDVNPNSTSLCDTLTTRELLYVRRKYKPGDKELIVGLETEPGGAVFEATVVMKKAGFFVEGSISRLNSYKNESVCAKNPVTKLFCHCKKI